jgi:PD-(D/E)XK nuclease superfamily
MENQLPRPLSISQVRLFLSCSYAWRLRYQLGQQPRVSAAAWFERLMREAIRLAYHGLSVDNAVREVFAQACSPIYNALEELITIDDPLQGSTTTKTVLTARGMYPQLVNLELRISDYQRVTLSHLRWGRSQTLADFFRRAIRLADWESAIIFKDVLLVEGQPLLVHEDSGPPIVALTDGGSETWDEEGKPGYTPLVGTIGGVAVAGVPDVVAKRGSTLLVADYKTGRAISHEAITEDAELVIYVELLRQNGLIAPGQPVEVGHIILGEHDVTQVWVDTATHERLLARIEQQLTHVAALIEAGLFIPRKGIESGFLSPCALCDLAHICDA